eukprot:TRINITY_DN2776_c4_g1_i1.p1 TRINITY_DN2776_c4_g1~~TRINITY_DN2776_c4_g1_i1.p1  ORF type:complete len:1269 (+),score=478.93 TRINITY_DN2776_c4_g1_i1:55-3807(+)
MPADWVDPPEQLVIDEYAFKQLGVYEGLDARGTWWEVIIEGRSREWEACFEATVQDGRNRFWPKVFVHNIRHVAVRPPPDALGQRGRFECQGPNGIMWPVTVLGRAPLPRCYDVLVEDDGGFPGSRQTVHEMRLRNRCYPQGRSLMEVLLKVASFGTTDRFFAPGVDRAVQVLSGVEAEEAAPAVPDGDDSNSDASLLRKLGRLRQLLGEQQRWRDRVAAVRDGEVHGVFEALPDCVKSLNRHHAIQCAMAAQRERAGRNEVKLVESRERIAMFDYAMRGLVEDAPCPVSCIGRAAIMSQEAGERYALLAGPEGMVASWSALLLASVETGRRGHLAQLEALQFAAATARWRLESEAIADVEKRCAAITGGLRGRATQGVHSQRLRSLLRLGDQIRMTRAERAGWPTVAADTVRERVAAVEERLRVQQRRLRDAAVGGAPDGQLQTLSRERDRARRELCTRLQREQQHLSLAGPHTAEQLRDTASRHIEQLLRIAPEPLPHASGGADFAADEAAPCGGLAEMTPNRIDDFQRKPHRALQPRAPKQPRATRSDVSAVVRRMMLRSRGKQPAEPAQERPDADCCVMPQDHCVLEFDDLQHQRFVDFLGARDVEVDELLRSTQKCFSDFAVRSRSIEEACDRSQPLIRKEGDLWLPCTNERRFGDFLRAVCAVELRALEECRHRFADMHDLKTAAARTLQRHQAMLDPSVRDGALAAFDASSTLLEESIDDANAAEIGHRRALRSGRCVDEAAARVAELREEVGRARAESDRALVRLGSLVGEFPELEPAFAKGLPAGVRGLWRTGQPTFSDAPHTVRAQADESADAAAAVLADAALLSRAAHPNLLPVVALYQSGGLLHLVTPDCGAAFGQWIVDAEPRDDCLRRAVRELLTAVGHLHSLGVVHGGIRADSLRVTHERALLCGLRGGAQGSCAGDVRAVGAHFAASIPSHFGADAFCAALEAGGADAKAALEHPWLGTRAQWACERRAECLVCCDIAPVTRGLTCDSGHFVCGACAEELLKRPVAESWEHHTRLGGRMECAARCGAAPFCDTDVARVVSKDAFAAYCAGIQELERSRISREAEDRIRRRLQEYRRLDEEEREVLLHQREVERCVFTLGCPKCGRAFADFDACAALRCPGCGCAFCAYCFLDCGEDAHDHVFVCSQGTGLYPKRGPDEASSSVDAAHRRWRQRQLNEYLGTVRKGIMAKLIKRIRPLAEEHGLTFEGEVEEEEEGGESRCQWDEDIAVSAELEV